MPSMNDSQAPRHIKNAASLPLPKSYGPEPLADERAQATFSVDEMAKYIHGEGLQSVGDIDLSLTSASVPQDSGENSEDPRE